MTFQSTLPARGATQSPRATVESARHFNPRSPHGERHGGGVLLVSLEIFQSTLPARGATPLLPQPQKTKRFQSTLPARGATGDGIRPAEPKVFQSTLPARGATPRLRRHKTSTSYFNPRSPHGERRGQRRGRSAGMISIHAPRTGSDQTCSQHPLSLLPYFNPRSPHGERHQHQRGHKRYCRFQSTLPARGATPSYIGMC